MQWSRLVSETHAFHPHSRLMTVDPPTDAAAWLTKTPCIRQPESWLPTALGAELMAVGPGTTASILLILDLGFVADSKTDLLLLTLDLGISKSCSVTARYTAVPPDQIESEQIVPKGHRCTTNTWSNTNHTRPWIPVELSSSKSGVHFWSLRSFPPNRAS